MAAVGDAQGAPLGLANRGAETLPVGIPRFNRWLWMEYVAVDAPGALDFYSRVVGYTSEVSETRAGRSYHLLNTHCPRAGLFASVWSAIPRCGCRTSGSGSSGDGGARHQLGGTVALAPHADIRNRSLAIVLDPAGAPRLCKSFPSTRPGPIGSTSTPPSHWQDHRCRSSLVGERGAMAVAVSASARRWAARGGGGGSNPGVIVGGGPGLPLIHHHSPGMRVGFPP